MSPAETVLTVFLAVVLVALAIYFGRRQLQMLRRLASPGAGTADERRYLRAQAYRRLFCSGLMFLFAMMLVGGLFLWVEYRHIEQDVQQLQIDNPGAPLTEDQKNYVRLFSVYWVVALVVVMVLVAVAGLDFWATARFGLAQHRQLQADQRALLLQQVAERRRRDRNGSS